MPPIGGIYPYGACGRSSSSIFALCRGQATPPPTGRAPHRPGHHGGMAEPLLIWLVLYAALFAAVGFVLMIGRAATGRLRSNVVLLRTASLAAFVLALAVWLVLLLVE